MDFPGLRLGNVRDWKYGTLFLLRIVIGWHLLYEGVAKILIPGWTSAPYLENSRWLFSGIFHWIASNAAVLAVVDWLNIAGLILIGLALITGTFTRFASISGMILLFLYYVANPPFSGAGFGLPSEGHYLFIDKNFVEMMALLVLATVPDDALPGITRMLKRKHLISDEHAANPGSEPLSNTGYVPERREALKNLAFLPLLGLFGYGAAGKYRWESVNAVSGATIQLKRTELKELKGELPKGSIGKFEISRLIMGGNLIGGWAHARDLLYVSQLFKAYNTEKKVFETLELIERTGINTMNTTPGQMGMIAKYKRITGSRLQTYCQVHPAKDDPYGDIQTAIDGGADMIQIQGNCTDWRVRDGEMDVLFRAMDKIREEGYLAGLGAHSVQALQACDDAGMLPDFYMKTLHHDRYWSAHPKENRIPFSVDGKKSADHNEFHDNMFCLFPDASIEFMKNKEIPWIAFKVLAGGAIHPSDGFRFAFENGADFICVGMFDWQIVEDVNIAISVLSSLEERTRPWV